MPNDFDSTASSRRLRRGGDEGALAEIHRRLDEFDSRLSALSRDLFETKRDGVHLRDIVVGGVNMDGGLRKTMGDVQMSLVNLTDGLRRDLSVVSKTMTDFLSEREKARKRLFAGIWRVTITVASTVIGAAILWTIQHVKF